MYLHRRRLANSKANLKTDSAQMPSRSRSGKVPAASGYGLFLCVQPAIKLAGRIQGVRPQGRVCATDKPDVINHPGLAGSGSRIRTRSITFATRWSKERITLRRKCCNNNTRASRSPARLFARPSVRSSARSSVRRSPSRERKNGVPGCFG